MLCWKVIASLIVHNKVLVAWLVYVSGVTFVTETGKWLQFIKNLKMLNICNWTPTLTIWEFPCSGVHVNIVHLHGLCVHCNAIDNIISDILVGLSLCETLHELPIKSEKYELTVILSLTGTVFVKKLLHNMSLWSEHRKYSTFGWYFSIVLLFYCVVSCCLAMKYSAFRLNEKWSI